MLTSARYTGLAGAYAAAPNPFFPVALHELLRARRADELLGEVEVQARERAPVVGDEWLVPQRPVRELVQHDTLRAVPTRERDRGVAAVEAWVARAEERLAGAVAGPEPGDAIVGVVRESLRPPE